MIDSLPVEISDQVNKACNIINKHLGSTLAAVHLYGSATDGGLKPYSDIDLLVTVNEHPNEEVRRALMLDLLSVSAPPGKDSKLRALEVTVIVYSEVVPWRYPPRRVLQLGEWLRKDILEGNIEPAMEDKDLTILLMQAREHGLALIGPEARDMFEPVPEEDFYKVLSDAPRLWTKPEDWIGDERNIMLTLARIWYSIETGRIAPKDTAASWLLERLPAEHRPILHKVRQAYLGLCEDSFDADGKEVESFMRYSNKAIARLLDERHFNHDSKM